MAQDRSIRCYDYVNRPYGEVRDALRRDPLALFHKATQTAASRAGSVASELRIELAGIDVGTEIDITVGAVDEEAAGVTSPASIRMQVEWQAASTPRLFPVMKGELAAYALSARETQLDFSGSYDPPMGKLGDVIDAVIAKRLADASVHRFLQDVAAQIPHDRRSASATPTHARTRAA